MIQSILIKLVYIY